MILFLLLPALFMTIYLVWQHFKEVPYDRVRRRMGHKKKRSKSTATLQRVFSVRNRLTYITLGSVTVGIYLAVAWLHATLFIGALVGGILPYLISETWKERWMDRYEEGVVQALEYGAGLFETGATVEQWVREVPGEIEGPIVSLFEKGKYQVESGQFSVVDWMRYAADDTPSSYFAYVINGIIANYEKANNLNEYMREVLDEINHKKRYERIMRMERDEAMKLLGAITLAPIALYAMFFQAINQYLAGNLTGNLIFGVGLGGYAAILLLARRTASAKPKI